MKNILLPINPEYVEKILSGEKIFEYRKKIPRDNIEYILIYETAPIKKIVAIALVDYVLNENKSMLWKKTENGGCVDRKYFDSYFRNVNNGFAIKFKRVFKFKKQLTLKALGYNYIPQSFSYYKKNNMPRLLSLCKPIKIKKSLIFLGGVHGSGKTTFANNILSTFGYSCTSASELIKTNSGEVNLNKATKNISNNQKILLSSIKKLKEETYKIVIDGHFCIIDKHGIPKKIPFTVFSEMRPSCIIVADISTSQLRDNLKKRNPLQLKMNLSEFQRMEREYAVYIAKRLNVPIIIVNTFANKKTLLNEIQNLFLFSTYKDMNKESAHD